MLFYTIKPYECNKNILQVLWRLNVELLLEKIVEVFSYEKISCKYERI